MSKNLCPENDIIFENSHTIRFPEPISAGEYTVSAIVTSTDTDHNTCLLLFYYEDNNTLEVYLSRSLNGERVSKTFTLAQDSTKVRIYASEGYSPSVGDVGTFNKLQIEAGNQMTDYVPYGEEEPTPEPEEPPLTETEELEVYYMALAGIFPVSFLPYPTCRETHLLRKLLDPSYIPPFPINGKLSRVEEYIWSLVYGGTAMLSNIPKSDREKYLHVALGGTVDKMPNPKASPINYWMNEWLERLGKV